MYVSTKFAEQMPNIRFVSHFSFSFCFRGYFLYIIPEIYDNHLALCINKNNENRQKKQENKNKKRQIKRKKKTGKKYSLKRKRLRRTTIYNSKNTCHMHHLKQYLYNIEYTYSATDETEANGKKENEIIG